MSSFLALPVTRLNQVSVGGMWLTICVHPPFYMLSKTIGFHDSSFTLHTSWNRDRMAAMLLKTTSLRMVLATIWQKPASPFISGNKIPLTDYTSETDV